ncbi:MAG: SusC/RagA family TonB-linked outer membrane protein [Candidatus Pseudobacter hemicellulosilyticus]|uniref:SusC/RagA family TonB-linked outer membrane protein n=1 Tax=Candidatus Pseudobacter hemicellulosilyticus TaxID=3121375 RepID=A0AAJ5WW69_9BACT|nr:MAG: SusC/RagA family TonB-linked outer membrane protein [Pseudobacter sp.]
MRLVLLLLVVATHVSVFAKAQKLSMKKQNVSLLRIIKDIRLQTGYNFLYDAQILEVAPTVCVSVTDGDIRDVLDQCIEGLPLTYVIMENNVIISLKKEGLRHMSATGQRELTGRITDVKGDPLQGVSVAIKGSSAGTSTNAEGKYTIKVPDGEAVLIFSMVGFEEKEITVGAAAVLNVILKQKASEIGDVVVVGYGTSKRKDVTSAINSVKLDQSPLADLPNANALLALSSTVPGININPQSLAGQDPLASMSIRGEKSIDKNSAGINRPLLVVDGVIFNGTINEINIQDVATIDLLKDASAVAIYGSRSANGVIIITTKKGRSEKPVITLNASYALQDWSRKPEMQDNMDIYLKNRWDFRVNRGDIPANTPFNPSMILNATELNAYEAGVYTNWLDEITQDAPVQNYNLSIAGDNKRVNYYLSAGVFDQKGVIMNDRYKKITFMGKIDAEISKYIKIGAKINYYAADNSGLRPKMQESTWMTPLSFTTNQTAGYESWLPSHPGGTATSPIIGSTVRPGPAYATNELKDKTLNGTGWLSIQAPWIKGLSYRISLNGILNSGVDNQMLDPRFWVDTRVPAQMINYNNLYLSRSTGYAQTMNRNNWLLDQILSYSNSFGNHSVDVMAGYTRDASRYDVLRATGTGFNMPNPLLWDGLNLATTQTVSKTQVRYQNEGMMGRISYNYAGKYYLAGSFRRDGFSGFAPKNKYGNFSGISGGWTLSKESFFDAVSWVNYLKLRVSYGETGNQGINPYETLSKIATSYNVYGSESQLNIYPTSMSNQKLTWSSTAMQNIGLDFSLFGQRLSGSIDVYQSKTTDQLLTRSIPILTGYSSVLTNVGRVDNKGIEVILNGLAVAGDGKRHFRWEPSIVFALNRNKLVDLYGTFDKNGLPVNDIGSTPTGDAYLVGKSIHAVWDLKMLGIVQTDDQEYITKYGAKAGDVKFLDYNNDGKINADDRHYQGDRDPLFTTNFNNTFSYKNFSLYISFKWTAGNNQHFLGRNPYGVMVSTSVSSNAQLKDVTPWTPENPTQEFPRVDWTNGMSYQFWRNRGFVKLKDIALSYTVAPAVLSRLQIQNARFFISANNVFTATDWNGLDPEDGGFIAAQPGSNYNWSFPVLRTFSAGAVLSF